MLRKPVGNWQHKRTVDLSKLGWHWPVSSKPGNNTQTNKPPNHYTTTGCQIIRVLFRKSGNIFNGSVPPYVSKSNNRQLTSLDLSGKSGRRMTSEWQINRFPSLLVVKMIWLRSALPTYSHTNAPLPPTNGGHDKLKPNIALLRVKPLMRGLAIHKIIPVSNTRRRLASD